MSKDHIFKKGDYVFAKVRGYPAWPARIEDILDPRPATLKYNVFFFGTSETAAVQAKEVYAYLGNKEKYGKPIKRKFFNEGIQELEAELRQVSGGEVFASNDSKSIKKQNPVTEVALTVADSQNASSSTQVVATQGDEETTAGKRKRKLSQAADVVKESETEPIAKRKRKTSEKAKEKKEVTESKGRRKNTSTDSRETADTDTGENDSIKSTKNDNTENEKNTVTKVLKNKSDAGVDNLKKKESDSPEGGKKRKRSSQEIEFNSSKEQISRSGRRIKPKKFLDDDENKEDLEGKDRVVKAKLSSNETKEDESRANDEKAATLKAKKTRKAKGSPSAQGKIKSHVLSSLGRVIWVKAKTGEVVQIKVDHNRPANLKVKEKRIEYESKYEEHLRVLKEKIEQGEMMTNEVLVQLKPSPESLASMTAEEIEALQERRATERKLGRTRWLRLESRLVNLDVLIRSALQKEKVNIEKAMELMDEYVCLPMDPLMLKKNPQLVETIKKLLNYTGNLQIWKMESDEEDVFARKAFEIRVRASAITNKFCTMFNVIKWVDLWDVFDESVKKFQAATKHLSLDSLYELTIDPSSPYYEEVAEYDREDREFDAKLKTLEAERQKNKAQKSS